MTYFNPLIAPTAGGTQVQRAAAAEKERQIARNQALRKNSAAEGDRFEHQVESADALTPVGDESSGGGAPRQQRQPKEDPHDQEPEHADELPPRLDVTG